MVKFLGALASTATLFLTLVQGQYVDVTGLSTGVNTATGARPVRQNINTLATSGAPWLVKIQVQLK